jgi:hypothetical protein
MGLLGNTLPGYCIDCGAQPDCIHQGSNDTIGTDPLGILSNVEVVHETEQTYNIGHDFWNVSVDNLNDPLAGTVMQQSLDLIDNTVADDNCVPESTVSDMSSGHQQLHHQKMSGMNATTDFSIMHEMYLLEDLPVRVVSHQSPMRVTRKLLAPKPCAGSESSVSESNARKRKVEWIGPDTHSCLSKPRRTRVPKGVPSDRLVTFSLNDDPFCDFQRRKSAGTTRTRNANPCWRCRINKLGVRNRILVHVPNRTRALMLYTLV